MPPTVLLIDDSENAPALRALLTDQGCEVVWATQGEVGVLLAQLRRPGVILVNPQVPVRGEPGGTLPYLQAVAAERRIAICALHAHPHPSDPPGWSGAFDRVLHWPANPDDIRAMVESCLQPDGET